MHARFGALAGHVLALLLATLSGARADASGVTVVIERQLGDTLAAALLAVDGFAAVRIVADGSDAACAVQPSEMPRLAVVVRQPRPPDIEACREEAAATVLAVTIGYQAIALVTPASAPAFSLPSSDLFRAVARHAGTGAVPTVWRDADKNLPALPVGLLAPPAGSAADRLLTATVMEPACRQWRGVAVPFELARRMDFCGALRADPSISRRHGGDQEIVDWAASAPAGQLAVASLAELRRLDGVVVALPLDGVLPTAVNVVAGRYSAAGRITLLIVKPRDAPPVQRDAMRQAAFELLSERSIGPDGSLALAGLVPVPPTERVDARSRVIGFLEQP